MKVGDVVELIDENDHEERFFENGNVYIVDYKDYH